MFHKCGQLRDAVHLPVGEPQNDIALSQASSFSGTLGFDLVDFRPLIILVTDNAQPSRSNVAVLDKVINDPTNPVYWISQGRRCRIANRKARYRIRRIQLTCDYANDFAEQIQHGAAVASGVKTCGQLYHTILAQTVHNSERDRWKNTEGISDNNSKPANLYLIRIPELYRLRIGQVQFQDGQSCFWVMPNELGVNFNTIGECDPISFGSPDYAAPGHNKTCIIEDRATPDIYIGKGLFLVRSTKKRQARPLCIYGDFV